MATARSSATIPPGTMFEYRVARLRFSQGYFVRRSIDVWPKGNSGNQLAELDCLAISFDPQLQKSLDIIECKTRARAQGEIDRLIWLKGIESFANANFVTFAKHQIAPRTREFARQIEVSVLDEAGIAAAEDGLGINPDWWPGFHDPVFGENVVKPARIALTSSPDLRRVGKYLFGTYWFADDFTRIKQLQTFFRLLNLHQGNVDPIALKLGVGEALTLFTLTTLSIASWRYQMTEEEFRQMISEELSTGLGDPVSLRTLLRQIDGLKRNEIEIIHNSYQNQGLGRIILPVVSLESEILKTPEWVDAFVNLVSRFSKRAHLATGIMRWVDLWASDLVGARQGLMLGGREGLRNLGRDDQQLHAALELVIAFLTRQWGVAPILFTPDETSESTQTNQETNPVANASHESHESAPEKLIQGEIEVPDATESSEAPSATDSSTTHSDADSRANFGPH